MTLQEKRAEVGAKASSGSQDQACDAILSKNTAVLIKAADQLLSTATTVHDGSVVDVSVFGGPPKVGARRRLARTLDSIQETRTSLSSSVDSTAETSLLSRLEQGQITSTEHGEHPSTSIANLQPKLTEDSHKDALRTSPRAHMDNVESSDDDGDDDDIELELSRRPLKGSSHWRVQDRQACPYRMSCTRATTSSQEENFYLHCMGPTVQARGLLIPSGRLERS